MNHRTMVGKMLGYNIQPNGPIVPYVQPGVTYPQTGRTTSASMTATAKLNSH